MGQLPLDDCERIRGYAAASVDGELSEVEAAALAAHVGACGPCNRFAAGLAQTARLIRATPVEPLEFPIVLPSRRLRLARTVQIGAAAAAVAAVVGLSATVGINAPAHRTAGQSLGAATTLQPEVELRMLRQASVRDRREHARFAR